MAKSPKRDFAELVDEFGVEVGKIKQPMYMVALMCAEAAANGFALSEDAGELLHRFWNGRRAGNNEPRVKEPPSSVQTSKFRRFLLLGEQQGTDGVENLRKVPELCRTLGFKSDVYNIALDVARDALGNGKPLNDRELRASVKRAIESVSEAKRKSERARGNEHEHEHAIQQGRSRQRD
ncbi:hypothetical protein [Methylocystis heyeri]|uniref:Uncharacterized protein n=1 Tax=Methylocystis heyeri TaxID=391905 RepID=A0A6B8KEP4_9HYPH|nr:hypothetical protein [Methylocystis heyeri]QGM46157.1 hypothetical protein H2LOC_010865 [Methylocystis heyeri]